MNRTRTTQLVLVGALAVASACGDDDVSSGPSNASDVSDTAPAVPTAESSPTEPQSTSPTTPDVPASDTSAVRGDDDGTDTPTTLADDAWIDHVGSTCDRLLWDANAIVPNDGTAEGWTREIADHRALFEGEFFSSVEVPQAVQPTLDAIHTMRDEALEWLAEADTRVESGDLGSVLPALWEAQDRLL